MNGVKSNRPFVVDMLFRELMFSLGLEIGYLDGLIRAYVSTEVKTPKREPKTTVFSADFDSWKSILISSYVIQCGTDTQVQVDYRCFRSFKSCM
jgi:hypothetical protein